jgi:hypothetical protein
MRRVRLPSQLHIKTNMKKLLLISAAAALAVGGLTNSAVAQEYVREYRADFNGGRSGRLTRELQRLDYNFERVRERLRQSGGGGRLWAQYGDLRRERERLNWQLRRGRVDEYRIRSEIDRLRAGLREIEERVSWRSSREPRGDGRDWR